VTVGGAHHCYLNALPPQPSYAASPFVINTHAAFEGKAEFDEELNRAIEVFDHDANVIHSFDCHVVTLGLGPLLTPVSHFSILFARHLQELGAVPTDFSGHENH
jgi:hypothetical protein